MRLADTAARTILSQQALTFASIDQGSIIAQQ
jgi:hypothetical protein